MFHEMLTGEWRMLGSSRKHIALLILITLFLAAFIVLATPARSYTMGEASQLSAAAPVAGRQALDKTPITEVADHCAPLLQPAALRDAGSVKVRDDAGHAAVLGLILGVRYALGPTEIPGQNGYQGDGFHSDVSGVRARAVAQYRHCRNQELLKSL